jgi:thioredoxin
LKQVAEKFDTFVQKGGIMQVLDSAGFKDKIFNWEEGGEWKFKGKLPAIIDFYADWCGPCRALSPILEELSTEYAGKIEIYKVDTEATPELAALFEVRGIPSLLFIPMDGEPAMATGLVPKPQLEKTIREILKV